jgi:hypothetical protein
MLTKKLRPGNRLGSLRREGGQALLIVLVLLLVGSFILPPVLSHIGTALKSGRVYEPKFNEQYAADSGIEDGLWRIKEECLGGDYSPYDFETVWPYSLAGSVNGLTVDETIQNVWLPSNCDPPAETPEDVEAIMESNKLMIVGTGNAFPGSTYKITISFYPGEGEENDLKVESIGVWLPYGFRYASGNTSLEENPLDPCYAVAEVSDHAGGQAVVWDYTSTNFTLFPPADGDYQSAEITFDYTANVTGEKPAAVAWVETSGGTDVLPITWDIDTRIFKITSSAGNTEVEAYAAKCEMRQLGAAISGHYRAIGNSLEQDKYDSHGHLGTDGVRDTWLASSTTSVESIPNGDGDYDDDGDYADVIAAYLYWSGSFVGNFTTALVSDNCSSLGGWSQTGSVWATSSGQFVGHYTGNVTGSRYLEWKRVYDLSGYTEGQVVVEWDQDDGGTLGSTDGLTFQISSDNGTAGSWSDPITAFYDNFEFSGEQYFYYVIPQEYLVPKFKIRFHLEGCSGMGQYAYIDDFAVARITAAADTGAKFWIDGTQVYLDGDGNPHTGTSDVTADDSHVLGFTVRGEYAYACKADVTKLVKAYAEMVEDAYENDHRTGNADYTVGDVQADVDQQRSYAGWSLVIIYSSPKTAGHMLYLYDTPAFNTGYKDLDFDADGQPGGDISDFIVPERIGTEENAATLTCFVGEGDLGITGDYLAFNGTKLWDGTTTSGNSESSPNNVWNSTSIDMSEDGVDVDTFTVTWDSYLLEPGDTEAHIGIWTNNDNWMLVYIILSLRSETTVGSTTSYIIR